MSRTQVSRNIIIDFLPSPFAAPSGIPLLITSGVCEVSRASRWERCELHSRSHNPDLGCHSNFRVGLAYSFLWVNFPKLLAKWDWAICSLWALASWVATPATHILSVALFEVDTYLLLCFSLFFRFALHILSTLSDYDLKILFHKMHTFLQNSDRYALLDRSFNIGFYHQIPQTFPSWVVSFSWAIKIKYLSLKEIIPNTYYL